jgi:hypothetical protein
VDKCSSSNEVVAASFDDRFVSPVDVDCVLVGTVDFIIIESNNGKTAVVLKLPLLLPP